MAKVKGKKNKKSPARMIEDAKKELAKKKDAPVKVAKVSKKVEKYKASPVEAKDRTSHIKEMFSTMGKMWWELGAEVKKAIDDKVPEALGKSAHEWMTECFGDSWLKIYRAHRIMKAMSGVEMDKLQKISEGNAYSLARLPEKVRKSDEWVKKAATLGNDEFKEATEKFITKKTGAAPDPMVKITDVLGFQRIPKTLADVVKVSMKQAAEAVNVDLDTAVGKIDAFEAIVSDYQLNNRTPQTESLSEEMRPEE